MIYFIALYDLSRWYRARRRRIEREKLETFNNEFYTWLEEYEATKDQKAL